jgi:hypothetical protein
MRVIIMDTSGEIAGWLACQAYRRHCRLLLSQQVWVLESCLTILCMTPVFTVTVAHSFLYVQRQYTATMAHNVLGKIGHTCAGGSLSSEPALQPQVQVDLPGVCCGPHGIRYSLQWPSSPIKCTQTTEALGQWRCRLMSITLNGFPAHF